MNKKKPGKFAGLFLYLWGKIKYMELRNEIKAWLLSSIFNLQDGDIEENDAGLNFYYNNCLYRIRCGNGCSYATIDFEAMQLMSFSVPADIETLHTILNIAFNKIPAEIAGRRHRPLV